MPAAGAASNLAQEAHEPMQQQHCEAASAHPHANASAAGGLHGTGATMQQIPAATLQLHSRRLASSGHPVVTHPYRHDAPLTTTLASTAGPGAQCTWVSSQPGPLGGGPQLLAAPPLSAAVNRSSSSNGPSAALLPELPVPPPTAQDPQPPAQQPGGDQGASCWPPHPSGAAGPGAPTYSTTTATTVAASFAPPHHHHRHPQQQQQQRPLHGREPHSSSHSSHTTCAIPVTCYGPDGGPQVVMMLVGQPMHHLAAPAPAPAPARQMGAAAEVQGPPPAAQRRSSVSAQTMPPQAAPQHHAPEPMESSPAAGATVRRYTWPSGAGPLAGPAGACLVEAGQPPALVTWLPGPRAAQPTLPVGGALVPHGAACGGGLGAVSGRLGPLPQQAQGWAGPPLALASAGGAVSTGAAPVMSVVPLARASSGPDAATTAANAARHSHHPAPRPVQAGAPPTITTGSPTGGGAAGPAPATPSTHQPSTAPASAPVVTTCMHDPPAARAGSTGVPQPWSAAAGALPLAAGPDMRGAGLAPGAASSLQPRGEGAPTSGWPQLRVRPRPADLDVPQQQQHPSWGEGGGEVLGLARSPKRQRLAAAAPSPGAGAATPMAPQATAFMVVVDAQGAPVLVPVLSRPTTAATPLHHLPAAQPTSSAAAALAGPTTRPGPLIMAAPGTAEPPLHSRAPAALASGPLGGSGGALMGGLGVRAVGHAPPAQQQQQHMMGPALATGGLSPVAWPPLTWQAPAPGPQTLPQAGAVPPLSAASAWLGPPAGLAVQQQHAVVPAGPAAQPTPRGLQPSQPRTPPGTPRTTGGAAAAGASARAGGGASGKGGGSGGGGGGGGVASLPPHEIAWLDVITTTDCFFKVCDTCGGADAGLRPDSCATSVTAQAGVRDVLVTFMDLDAPEHPGVCASCREQREALGHRLLQVRRSTYHDVVRQHDLLQLKVDLAGVQCYSINNAKVVFLQPRPATKPSKVSTMPSRCVMDGRQLMDVGARYCSLRCKLDVELHGRKPPSAACKPTPLGPRPAAPPAGALPALPAAAYAAPAVAAAPPPAAPAPPAGAGWDATPLPAPPTAGVTAAFASGSCPSKRGREGDEQQHADDCGAAAEQQHQQQQQLWQALAPPPFAAACPPAGGPQPEPTRSPAAAPVTPTAHAGVGAARLSITSGAPPAEGAAAAGTSETPAATALAAEAEAQRRPQQDGAQGGEKEEDRHLAAAAGLLAVHHLHDPCVEEEGAAGRGLSTSPATSSSHTSAPGGGAALSPTAAAASRHCLSAGGLGGAGSLRRKALKVRRAPAE